MGDCALVCARSPMSCAMYSAGLGEIEEHHFLTYRVRGKLRRFQRFNCYTSMKTRTTAISQTKTQALARTLASVTHGYTRVCMGTMPPERLSVLAVRGAVCIRHWPRLRGTPTDALLHTESCTREASADRAVASVSSRNIVAGSAPLGALVACAGTQSPARSIHCRVPIGHKIDSQDNL